MRDLIGKAPEPVAALERACHDCNPTPCCEYEAIGKEAAALIAALQSENAELRATLSNVKAERAAAVELVGKLERCLLFLSTTPECQEGGMVFRHTVDYAETALAQWRGAQGEG